MAITVLEQGIQTFQENVTRKYRIISKPVASAMCDEVLTAEPVGLDVPVAQVPVENLMQWVSIPAALIVVVAAALQVVA